MLCTLFLSAQTSIVSGKEACTYAINSVIKTIRPPLSFTHYSELYSCHTKEIAHFSFRNDNFKFGDNKLVKVAVFINDFLSCLQMLKVP